MLTAVQTLLLPPLPPPLPRAGRQPAGQLPTGPPLPLPSQVKRFICNSAVICDCTYSCAHVLVVSYVCVLFGNEPDDHIAIDCGSSDTCSRRAGAARHHLHPSPADLRAHCVAQLPSSSSWSPRSSRPRRALPPRNVRTSSLRFIEIIC